MGPISSFLGTAGGQSGTGIAAPTTNAGLIQPTNAQQLQDAYNLSQQGLLAQQGLLTALQGQNGLGNQSQVYNQLQGVANGTGPNPAQAMLNQATGQNINNQAALMAGQRGANANVGLIARQAAMQGANTQQQAVGQGAALQAQQALNAINSAGGIANTQAQNQIGATADLSRAQQGEQQNLLGALQGYNAAQAGLQGGVNTANAQLANTTMQGQQAFIGGGLQGAGAAAKYAMAGGGAVPHMNDGGAAGGSWAKRFLDSWGNSAAGGSGSDLSAFGQMGGGNDDTKALNKGMSSFTQNIGSAFMKPAAPPPAIAPSGGVRVFAGPGEAHGGAIHDFRVGGDVMAKSKSQKATVSGNSYANDKIPAVLSEGEYVIDRESLNDRGPLGDAARRLVQALEKAKGRKT